MGIYLPIAELSVNLFVLLAMGAAVGFLSGMFGVGGGFLITPLLIFYNIPPPIAVATGANVIPIAVTSGRCWPRRSFSFIPGVVDVSIGAPVASEGREPGELMDEIERWIEAEMRRLDPQAYRQVASAQAT